MYNFFFYKNIIFGITFDFFKDQFYIEEIWFFFSNIIIIVLISFFIIMLGIIFPNKAKIIKFLNLISAFYLFIFFFLTSFEYNYDLGFEKYIQNYYEINSNLYINLFFFVSTVTIFLFFLSISDIFFIEENNKIEYVLLVIYIYIGSLFLISSLDFISIIITLECISFSSYVLVGFERKNKFSTSSGLKYLILAAIPSGFFILGISILYYNFSSFNQNHIERLLNSFNNNNLTSIDWLYTAEYYSITYNFNVLRDWNVFETIFLKNIFIDYLQEINFYLQVYHPLSFLINMLEIETILKYIFNYNFNNSFNNSPKLFNNFLILINYRYELEQIYINYYSKYLFLISILLDLKGNWLFLNLIFDAKLLEVPFGINDPLFIFLKEFFFNLQQTNGYLDWISFISYYLYFIDTIEHPSGIQEERGNYFEMLRGFYQLNSFQTGNLNKLISTNISSENSIDNDVFWTLSNLLNMKTTSILNNINYFINMFFYKNNYDFSLYSLNLNIDQLDDFYLNLMKFFKNTDFAFNNVAFNYNLDYNLNIYNFQNEINLYFFDNISLSFFIIIIFILINLSFKITAAPFHFWAPSVYNGSPLPTITFLSVFSKLTIFFFIIYLFLTTFENLKNIWQPIFFFLGIFSVIISIIGAFSEKIFKRFFVYSSIGHVGFIILGIAVLNYDGIQGALDYLFIYVISSFIIWFIIMHLTKKTTHLISFKGLSINYPILSLILVVSFFSISGLPPMAGFFVKFEIFYSLINSSQYFLAYFLLILTVFSFFYYLRLIKIIYFENNVYIKKNKNQNDIKLRLISILIFIIPLYIILLQEPFFFLLKEIIINSIK